MATDEQKKKNQLRLANMTLFGVTAGVWDLLGEGASGLTHQIGSEILPVMENEMGLEIAGESPEDVLQEVARLFVDEFGFAKDIEVTSDGDVLKMKVAGCLNYKLTQDLTAAGVERPFVCPYLAAATAVFDRMGIKAMTKIDTWSEKRGSVLSFELF